MDARYKAIPSHYSSNVIAVLEQIRAMRDLSSSQQQQQVLVGAITDGNSDPRNVPALSQFFDFCINAEQVGVSKPDKRIYLQAMELVHTKMMMIQNDNKKTGEDSVVDLENWVGPWWIHVGDDFSKDIVAAKNLKLRTVWVREWITTNQQPSHNKHSNDSKPDASSSEQELIEFQKRMNGQPIVTMAIGSDDYLAASIQREFADAIIENFEDLTSVLREWQDQSEAQRSATSQSQETIRGTSPSTSGGVMGQETSSDVTIPTSAANGQEVTLEGRQSQSDDEALRTKFCIYCGAKIPFLAIYCPSCSKKQPAVSE
jgi:FMN phosphatase YigB (HAD superfamily)